MQEEARKLPGLGGHSGRGAKARRSSSASIQDEYRTGETRSQRERLAQLQTRLSTGQGEPSTDGRPWACDVECGADYASIYVVASLRQEGEIEKEVRRRFLVRNWPPAFIEWSTKSVRDAFFASPQFPRLLYPDSIRETIARGVSEGLIGYGARTAKGEWSTIHFKERLDVREWRSRMRSTSSRLKTLRRTSSRPS